MIVVAGAGITGLTLAWLLREKGLDVLVFEAGQQVGGNIRSVREADCLLETGPNSLRLNDFLYHYLDRLGLAGDIVQALPQARHRYVLRNGAYRRLPSGPLSLIFSGFLSFKEKRRIFRERKIPAGNDPLETVDAFFRRRFGDAVADYLVAPFISGIYAGDPRQLILAEAFPQVKKWEQQHGSVIRGAMRGRTKNQHKGIVSLTGGLQMLPLRLAEGLGDHLRLNCPVRSLAPEGHGFRVQLQDGQAITAEKVVLTIPASASARLMQGFAPETATALEAIPYPPVALVHSLYRKEDVAHALDGFGALNNYREDRFSLGTIFSSSTFPGRAPEGTALLTSFVGGAVRPELAGKPENEIFGGVHGELGELLGVRGRPLFQKCTHYPQAIPQYTTAALPSRARAHEWGEKGLHLAGNWIGGISVVACIERAHELCEQLTAGHG
jgi:oxygen-dependent protoporphyrinogen oxidase